MENQQATSLSSSLKKGIFPLFLLFIAWIVFFNSEVNIIISGIAIFLIGMLFMEDGFKLFSGGVLENVLEKSTNNLPKSIGIGFLTTSIVQSSSLISVIVISFLSANLISLSGAIGVIFGSNIGTTTTAWIVSTLGVKISISKYAMPMLIFGVIFHFNKNKSFQGFGKVLIGLGFVFLGIAYMKDGFEVFQGNLDLSAYVADGFLGILIFILLGAIATILIQSSSATMALIITALISGQIIYTQALALAIGANIGTTVTAVIGALASNHNGKRLAVAHFIFNIVTALIAIGFLNQLANLVDYLSTYLNISPDNYAMKLALFHTIFNVIGVLAVTPFTKYLVNFLEKLFIPVEDKSKAKYLDIQVIQSSAPALSAIKNEVVHLYENTALLLSHALLIHRHEYFGKKDIYTIITHTHASFDESIQTTYDNKIKYLYSDIVYYNTLASDNIEQQDKNKLYKLRLAAQSLVSTTKDIQEINKNLLYYNKGKNEAIKDEYNTLRLQILQILNTLESIRYNTDDIDSLTTLELYKEEMKNFEYNQHSKIEKLIRDKTIDSKMATSLLNDSTYTYEIVQNLIKVGYILWLEDQELQSIGEYHENH